MINTGFIIGKLNKEHGGAQQLLFDICRHLPNDEFEITVYYMFGEGTYRPLFEKNGATVIDLDARSNYDLVAFRRLIKKLNNDNHDIFHTNSPISGCWGRIGAKLAGIPNIVSVEHNVHHEYSGVTQFANGSNLPLADVIIGVSDSVSNSYLSWEKALISRTSRCTTIKNGVDVRNIESYFSDSNKMLYKYTQFSTSDTIVGTMGRLAKQKGYEYLIHSFPKIKKEHKNAKLLVIGDGPNRNKLEKIASKTNYRKDIKFTGYVSEVYPFLPTFDVAVFPSLWEGFGLTPVESMVAKRPIVATDIPTFQEVIGDAGLLVERKNGAALATAINSLLDDPIHREELAQQGYNRAIKRFSIERTVEEYAELYRELL
jgi:glycosyltransferase involved in cell wall biosynthesis